MTHHEADDRRLIDAVFGEGSINPDELDKDSRREVAQLQELDLLLSTAGRREPDASRRHHLWTRIESRLEEKQPGLTSISRWGAVMASLSAAFIIAVLALPRNAPVPELTAAIPTPSVPVPDEASAALRLDRLLKRSQPLLMAVSNRAPGGTLGAERRLAADLAIESRAVVDELDHRRTRRDRELAAELEAVLLQISNANRANDLVLVRSTLEERRILLSIALRDMRRARAADIDHREIPDQRKIHDV